MSRHGDGQGPMGWLMSDEENAGYVVCFGRDNVAARTGLHNALTESSSEMM